LVEEKEEEEEEKKEMESGILEDSSEISRQTKDKKSCDLYY
jgi:hypothetical protein